MHWTQTAGGKRLLRRRSRAAWKRRKAAQGPIYSSRDLPSQQARPRKRTQYIAGSVADELMVLTQILNLVKSLSDAGLRYLKDRI